MDIMDRIEEILKAKGIELEYIWEEACDNGWYYLQCNVREAKR